MVKKLWVKFEGMDVACVCETHHRKCQDKICLEYVVSFIEIDRTNEKLVEGLNESTKDLTSSLKKFQSEVARSVKNLKKIKI